jgi:Family of unknown function (DUF5675)
LNNVPGFKNIQLHAGNTAKDTEGCILVGGRFNGVDAIADSRAKNNELKQLYDNVHADDVQNHEQTQVFVNVYGTPTFQHQNASSAAGLGGNSSSGLQPDGSSFGYVGSDVPAIGTATGTYFFANGDILVVTVGGEDTSANSTDDGSASNEWVGYSHRVPQPYK